MKTELQNAIDILQNIDAKINEKPWDEISDEVQIKLKVATNLVIEAQDFYEERN